MGVKFLNSPPSKIFFKKWASGEQAPLSSVLFTTANRGNNSYGRLVVRGLKFKPSRVVAYNVYAVGSQPTYSDVDLTFKGNDSLSDMYNYYWNTDPTFVNSLKTVLSVSGQMNNTSELISDDANCTFYNDGFSIPIPNRSGTSITWIAFE
jgi:hypothetical protein